MTDDSDEILDELRAALNVEPSPEFEARVRMATHASRRAGAVWIEPRRVWIWRIVASGAVAAAAIVAVLLRPGDVAAPSPVAAARPQPAAVGTAPARSIQQTATVVAKPLVPAPRMATRPARATSATRGARPEPQVLVPAGQIELLHSLVAMRRAGVSIPDVAGPSDDGSSVEGATPPPFVGPPSPVVVESVVVDAVRAPIVDVIKG
jgi:hypothetical protein